MGTNTLASFTSGAITVDTVNQYFTALGGNFVPRQVSGSSAAPIDNTYFLGTASYRWKEAHVTDLYLNGSLFDPDAVGVDSKFAINSGQTVSGSDKSDFIRASGSGASATILATTTNLQITANSVSVTVTSDISVSSLTVAPSTNNTCLIDDTVLAGGNETKYTGENENDPITIDTVGTEITDRIGQYVCLKHNTTGEYIFAYVEDATTLNRCYRGFFFDSSGNPVTRDVLSNNDQLNLMSLGWVFLDNDGTTVDVSYTSPVYSATEPASPVTDDYWFDLTNRLWKRYSGSAFVQVDRILLGLVVVDTTNCVASRSFDFTKAYDPFISLEVELDSTTVVKTSHGYSAVNVNGQTQELYAGAFQWDITSDLESGLTEASSTHYYLYVTEDGAPIISEERPYNREHDLRGYYHPYNSWRYVGMAFNDGSSDLTSARSKNNPFLQRQEVFTASGTYLPLPNSNKGRATVIGGGGGGGGSAGNGGAGGTSSFGSYASATGGGGGDAATVDAEPGGTAGSGSGGDINMTGQDGGNGFSDSGSTFDIGGFGGSSIFGGGGRQGTRTGSTVSPLAGNNYGAGGGGFYDTNSGAGGGAGGGASIYNFYGVQVGVTITVGAAGSAGSGSGTAGAAGIVIVEY